MFRTAPDPAHTSTSVLSYVSWKLSCKISLLFDFDRIFWTPNTLLRVFSSKARHWTKSRLNFSLFVYSSCSSDRSGFESAVAKIDSSFKLFFNSSRLAWRFRSLSVLVPILTCLVPSFSLSLFWITEKLLLTFSKTLFQRRQGDPTNNWWWAYRKLTSPGIRSSVHYQKES